MPIEIQYDNMGAVPEAFRELYTEKDGKAVLTGVNGMKTQADVDTVSEALRKERLDHKKAVELAKPWEGLDHGEVMAKLDKYPELEAAASGKMDEEKINQLVEQRIAQKTGPLERTIKTLTEERDTFKTESETLRSDIETSQLNEAVREVAAELKVHSTAIPDIELVAKSYLERDDNGNYIVKADAKGVTPGVDIKQFMKEMQTLRPHWWPQSVGGGAGGGNQGINGGQNPWSGKHWNMTEQSKIYMEQGAEIASEMAKSAGTSIGGARPADK